MTRRDFLDFFTSNAAYLSEAEKQVAGKFIANINESFLDDIFTRLLSTKVSINLRTLVGLYNELLEDEAMRLARLSRVKFSTLEQRWDYDPIELLKSYYLTKLKNKTQKKGVKNAEHYY